MSKKPARGAASSPTPTSGQSNQSPVIAALPEHLRLLAIQKQHERTEASRRERESRDDLSRTRRVGRVWGELNDVYLLDMQDRERGDKDRERFVEILMNACKTARQEGLGDELDTLGSDGTAPREIAIAVLRAADSGNSESCCAILTEFVRDKDGAIAVGLLCHDLKCELLGLGQVDPSTSMNDGMDVPYEELPAKPNLRDAATEAIACLASQPDLTMKEIASKAGVTRDVLNRSRYFAKFREIALQMGRMRQKGGRMSLPRGHKSNGVLDAYADD